MLKVIFDCILLIFVILSKQRGRLTGELRTSAQFGIQLCDSFPFVSPAFWAAKLNLHLNASTQMDVITYWNRSLQIAKEVRRY